MALHPLAGKPAPVEMLTDVAALERAFYELKPDPANPLERVSFGTSGHRGTSTARTFNEAHIAAIAEAIGEYRAMRGYTGPLFMGRDTHALSAAAEKVALDVLAANGVSVVVQSGGGFTPTPAISRAILAYNRGREAGWADGIVITPSHNPPADGGFKYNPPDGGPADTDVTNWIQDRANELLASDNAQVEHSAVAAAAEEDLAAAYVEDLASVIDFDVIRASGLKIGVDPLGGASVGYWPLIAERYRLNLEVVQTRVDPAFSFMTLDHDGKIRMDCSSPYAMAGLVALKNRFDVAFGNDPDADRHGIVTRSAGLMNPNHYLCVAIRYLLLNRPGWPKSARVGKTLVSSSLIDKVASSLGRDVYEVPVGFKWFTPGLHDSSVCFGGEESAGASFLRRDGRVWTTDKDGLILGLLAAEIMARTGRDPGEHYRQIEQEFGVSFYRRIDAPATPAQKAAFARLKPEMVTADRLAGSKVTAKLTKAPGNRAPIGGLKVVTEDGWFAARPSGTENIYKLYAESLKSESHLSQLIDEARDLLSQVL
ncbi:MAG: alpha-D-glucose phosphate-specific phosphoglucomutase [Bryobacteraceae bacterium]|nr:alpha-D-glucose phosphate-specific phosphoglucomutase [Bryobacteraceae bacterium]